MGGKRVCSSLEEEEGRGTEGVRGGVSYLFEQAREKELTGEEGGGRRSVYGGKEGEEEGGSKKGPVFRFPPASSGKRGRKHRYPLFSPEREYEIRERGAGVRTIALLFRVDGQYGRKSKGEEALLFLRGGRDGKVKRERRNERGTTVIYIYNM